MDTVLHGHTIIIQITTALKAEIWPGQERVESDSY